MKTISTSLNKIRQRSVATVLMLLVPLLFWQIGMLQGIVWQWSLVGLGALGWLVALWLRVPVIVLLRRFWPHQAQTLTILLSGPAEETVRLGSVLFLCHSVPMAYQFGLGWATIEVGYAMVTGFMVWSLSDRTDTKAEQAKAALAAAGMQQLADPSAVLWGAFERVSATALHIAFTLLLFVQPWLYFVTMFFHSATNYYFMKLMRRSLQNAELLLCTFCLVLFSLAMLATNLW